MAMRTIKVALLTTMLTSCGISSNDGGSSDVKNFEPYGDITQERIKTFLSQPSQFVTEIERGLRTTDRLIEMGVKGYDHKNLEQSPCFEIEGRLSSETCLGLSSRYKRQLDDQP